MTSIEARKVQLSDRRAALVARSRLVEDELDRPGTADWDDLATEREGDEVLENLGHSAVQEIAMIDAALARIAAGEYGHCTRCGSLISEARLDVLPYTPFCRSCAR
jgi:RNA polymerase-binding transcription factor DksA